MTKDLITKIRGHLPIAAFVAPYTGGLKQNRQGYFVGKCPFHQSDKKRTFWVDPKKGICGCFVPSCPAFSDRRVDPHSKPMDVINFYARLHNLSNSEAVEELAKWIVK